MLTREGAAPVSPVRAVPYRCGSWRCRRCGWQVARGDFRRVERATARRDWWLYAVFTFDPTGFSCCWEAYRDAGRRWLVLRKRLERAFGASVYLQTWERTRRGWPHVNVLIGSDGLRHETERQGVEPRPASRARSARVALFPRIRSTIRDWAVSAGFGPAVWVEVCAARSDGLAAYLTKTAHELTSAYSKDGDQTPLGAPPHFRRIRSSVGLLEPPARVVQRSRTLPDGSVVSELVEKRGPGSGDVTGVLCPKPLATFDRRAPGWSDVADAWDYQSRAARRRHNGESSTCEVRPLRTRVPLAADARDAQNVVEIMHGWRSLGSDPEAS